jgi:uncharacterized protein (TIGR01244 family)
MSGLPSIPLALALFAAASAGGCGEPAPQGPENGHASEPEALATGGQPDPERFDELVAAGYRTFVNLRLSDEPGTGWEAARAQELGVEYVAIPVAGAEDVTEAKARELSRALDRAAGPAYVYCRSGNRVGALLALEAFHVDGKDREEALAIGRAGGLTKLEPDVREALGLPPSER